MHARGEKKEEMKQFYKSWMPHPQFRNGYHQSLVRRVR